MAKREDPTIRGKGFESLDGFNPTTPAVPESSAQQPEEVASSATHVTEAPISTPEVKPGLSEELGLVSEDVELFGQLIRLVNQDILAKDPESRWVRKRLLASKAGDVNRYWRVRDLVRDSRGGDVSYHLNRFLGRIGDIPAIRGIYQDILMRGYKAQAVRFLEGLTPENMKYGPSSMTPAEKRADRIASASKFAKMAGLDLKQIASENNLLYLLNE